MKVSLEIHNHADAVEAANMMLALADTLKASGDTVATRSGSRVQPRHRPLVLSPEPPAVDPGDPPPKKERRGRPAGKPKETVASDTSDDRGSVAAIVADDVLDDGVIDDGVIDDAVIDPADDSLDYENAVKAPAVAAALRNGNDQHVEPSERDRLKSIAREQGVLWLRPRLEERDAKRLSDLSDDQVRDLLRDAGAETC